MQLALKSSDLSLAISHLKESLRIEQNAEEDAFLAELLLQKGLLDIQSGGRWFRPIRSGLKDGNIGMIGTKYYEAVAYLLGDRKAEALEKIEQMLKDNPRNTEAYVLKGSHKLTQQRHCGVWSRAWKGMTTCGKHT